MTITVHGVHDLATWAISKACNGWRSEGVCYDKDTGDPLPWPHAGCVQAQQAADLLAGLDRYEGADVVGWLVSDDAINPDLW